MTANFTTVEYRLDSLPGVMPERVRKCLKKAGHKLGNPSPETTSFTPRDGWTTEVNGDHAILRDPNGHDRLRYYPEAKVARVGRDGNGHYTPQSAIVTQPWMDIIPRYQIQRFDLFRFCIVDAKVDALYGGFHGTYEEAVQELNENKPNWQYGWYWEDETPTKWWHRLIFWRRNTKSDVERRLLSDDGYRLDAMTTNSDRETTAN
jgi:hypothetical protein